MIVICNKCGEKYERHNIGSYQEDEPHKCKWRNRMKFTKEELYTIEQNFDSWASLTTDRIKKLAEQFFLINAQGEKKMAKILLDQLFELADANRVVKSIRDKCEKERLK